MGMRCYERESEEIDSECLIIKDMGIYNIQMGIQGFQGYSSICRWEFLGTVGNWLILMGILDINGNTMIEMGKQNIDGDTRLEMGKQEINGNTRIKMGIQD